MTSKGELEVEIKEIELMISLIRKYIDEKELVKSTARSVKKVVKLAQLESSNRKRKIETLVNEPKTVIVSSKNDIFDKKLVVSGGAFGMGRR